MNKFEPIEEEKKEEEASEQEANQEVAAETSEKATDGGDGPIE